MKMKMNVGVVTHAIVTLMVSCEQLAKSTKEAVSQGIKLDFEWGQLEIVVKATPKGETR